MKHYVLTLFVVITSIIKSQTPVYDDLIFEEDSTTNTYKAIGKNFFHLKSKKGSGGMAHTSTADSNKTAKITDIILVFSETSADAIAEREQANRERWENLLNTYPEFFQFNTNYKTICQCKIGGDAEAFKHTQGFYLYFAKDEPKPVVISEKPKQNSNEKTTDTKKTEITTAPEKPSNKEKTSAKDNQTSKNTKSEKVKPKEEPKVEPKEEEITKTDGPDQTSTIDLSSTVKKREGYTKPKKAKNNKLCRPPFYGSGEDDINIFFKENIALDKKTTRKVKGDESILKLSLNFDGSVKKAMVSGPNTLLNDLISAAVKSMDLWNPSVKGGITTKSEIKMTMKYDKSTKAIRPFETVITPRPAPKCSKCLSDSEIFGD
ncbi:MAG: hypothetical protein JSU07_09160 [Bacteroidetes bacterium]|nr:hypothetical protein [Bacteroidota bacterium]